MSAKHAILGASSAKRWLSCTPSAQLTAEMPDTAGRAAAEGTLAHAIGELKLRKHFTPFSPRKFAAEMKKLQADPLYDPEMVRSTDEYLDAVKEIALEYTEEPYIALEQRVDYSDWVPGGFGTADCIVVGGCILHVIDFKNGKGVPVPAEDNPQMMLYALGAWKKYQWLYPVDTIRMTIVQPRKGGVLHAHMDLETLLKWANDYVKPRAVLADAGEGDYCVGDWCRFCKASATCRARSDHNLTLEGFRGALPPEITDAEVGQALRQGQDLKSWLAKLEEYALNRLLTGGDVPGWKAVEGRATRAWTDQTAAFMAAKAAGIEDANLYKTEPLTLAAMEKAVGKKAFAETLGSYIHTPPGKPALVDATDRRPPITNRPSAEDDFDVAVQ